MRTLLETIKARAELGMPHHELLDASATEMAVYQVLNELTVSTPENLQEIWADLEAIAKEKTTAHRLTLGNLKSVLEAWQQKTMREITEQLAKDHEGGITFNAPHSCVSTADPAVFDRIRKLTNKVYPTNGGFLKEALKGFQDALKTEFDARKVAYLRQGHGVWEFQILPHQITFRCTWQRR